MDLRSLLVAFGLAVLAPPLLAAGIRPAAAQQAEADVFVAKAALAYDEKRYDEAPHPS